MDGKQTGSRAPSDRSPRTRQCILVAGMHRSGTSAAARVINLLGADIVQELLPPLAGDNDRDLWESPWVIEIHDRLLQALDSAWDDPLPLRQGWLETSATREAKLRISEEIRREFGQSDLFVVKDPRISRLLPLWFEVLDELGIEPVVVIPLRNPLEVPASLESRNGLPQAQSLLMYARSILETELASRGRRRIFLRYDRLLEDWRPFARRLRQIVGSHLAGLPPDRAREIDEFLTTDLHRNRRSQEFAGADGLADAIAEIFARTNGAADKENEPVLRAAFDRIRARVDEATKLFQGLILAERDKHREAEEQLKGELASIRVRTTELEAAFEARSVLAARLDEQLRVMGDQLAAARRRALELDAMLSAYSAESERLATELRATRGLAAELRNTIEANSAETARLESDLVRAQRVTDALNNVLRSMRMSRSWKLTAPLRSFCRITPRIGRLLRHCLTLIRLGIRPPLRLLGRQAEVELIIASGLFDITWYLGQHDDVRRARIDPLLHYLLYGGAEGRDPNPLFDSDWYLQQNSDVHAAGINPLLHYLQYGGAEGRDPHPLFDTDWYLANNPDVSVAGLNPLSHYLQYGAFEGRAPNSGTEQERAIRGHPNGGTVAEIGRRDWPPAAVMRGRE